MKKLPTNKIGKKEITSVVKILKLGNLSNFLGEKHPDFFGGKYVKKFENDLCKFYNSKYAITVNSWTSGLVAIFGLIFEKLKYLPARDFLLESSFNAKDLIATKSLNSLDICSTILLLFF